MAEPSSSSFLVVLSAICHMIIGVVSAICALFIDNELARIAACSFIGSFGASLRMQTDRSSKLTLIVVLGLVGMTISGPTCFFLARFTDAPFQTWSGFVSGAGTWFMAWFLHSFRDHIKRWLVLILDALVLRVTRHIRGKE